MTTLGSVEDYKELQGILPSAYDLVIVRQYKKSTLSSPLPFPCAGGIFCWDENSEERENDSTIHIPDSAKVSRKKGRWKRLFTGPIDIRWFGASPSNVDNTDAIQAAIDTGYPVYIPYDKVDEKTVPDGEIKKGTKELFSATARFTPNDVDKTISIEKAGIAGQTLNATIQAAISPTQVNLDKKASISVSIVKVTWWSVAFKFARRLKLRPGTVILGDGWMSSILEFTGCGIAIDDVDYGPATRSILYGFKLQASGDGVSTIGIQMTDATIVVLENLWIEGSRSHWSVAGLSILGRQRESGDVNTYAYRILGCDISGCNGDGILVKDDAGTGGLHVFHSRIQGCKGIGFNQVFGSNGPGYKCQVHVEGNDIEGNDEGQVKCDSVCGSTFKNNHLENSRLPGKSATIPPMSFGARPIPSSGFGVTIGRNAYFSKIEEGDTLFLEIDKGRVPIIITFSAGDRDVKKIKDKINEKVSEKMGKPLTIAYESTARESKGQLMLASPTVFIFEDPPAPQLTVEDLRNSQVVISGSSCVLGKLGLTAGIYTAHYAWNGQFFGLTVSGNTINSTAADWAIEFPSTSGSVGIVVSGNQIIGPTDGGQKKPLAAIVSRPQLNMDISGNSCTGVFEKKDYAHYYTDWKNWAKDTKYPPPDYHDDWFSIPANSLHNRLSVPNSFHGQDIEGHQFLGDLRFGITVLTDTTPSVIDSRSYTFHIKTVNHLVSFTLPDHKIGKRFLFKNIGLQPTIIKPKLASETIDSKTSYTLHPYDFVELEDDGKLYWIIRK